MRSVLVRVLLLALAASLCLSFPASSAEEAAKAPDSGNGWLNPAQQKASDDSPRRGARPAANKPTADKVWRSEELDMLGVGMSVGDLDGDGANEIAIISPSSVHVYRVTQGRMEQIAEYAASPLELKSVDIAKVRKQGPARIYVTAQSRGVVSSFVLELRGRTLEPVISEVRFFLRVIDYPTKGPILLGQAKGLQRMYEGPIYRMTDKGTSIEPSGRFGVPLKIPIFGFAIGDFEGKRNPLIAVYDKEDHLRIYNPAGKRLYLSKDFFGGSDVVLRWSGPEDKRDTDRPFGDVEKVFFRPRIMAQDLRNNGTYEILALSHTSKTQRYFSRTKMLEEGKVCCLIWNGDALEESWRTPPIQGMITDFAVNQLPGVDGKRLIILERLRTDWFSFIKSKSQVKAYDLEALTAGAIHDDRR